MNVAILGTIPLEKQIIQCCETGTPSCIKYPDSAYTLQYRDISKKIINYLDELDDLNKGKAAA